MEEGKKPKITKDFIIFTLNKFRNLDLKLEKNKERLIDGLVKAIFVYDDYIKVFLTFDDKPIDIPTAEDKENMSNSSDIARCVSPIKTSLKNEVFIFCFLAVQGDIALYIGVPAKREFCGVVLSPQSHSRNTRKEQFCFYFSLLCGVSLRENSPQDFFISFRLQNS